jgi:hypothetical protein
MGIERQIGGVEAHRIHVIKHQPYPDSPVSGCEDFPRKQFAGYIAFPVVVLKIETSPSLMGKVESETKGLQVVTNYANASLPFVPADLVN